jgi:hypothetical protein
LPHELRGPVLLHGLLLVPVCRRQIITTGDAEPIAS